MWRAFFFAIGTTLIILGVQCLIVDHFVVANGTRVPSFVAKYLQSKSPKLQKPDGPVGQLVGINRAPNPTNPMGQVGFTQPYSNSSSQFSNTGSRFGPSRFADSQFSNTQLPPNTSYYGGRPFSSNQAGQYGAAGNNSGPQFSVAGYGRSTVVNASSGDSSVGRFEQTGAEGAVSLGRGPSTLIKPKDWMPWCLLAVGTLVVLYTNSTSRRYSTD